MPEGLGEAAPPPPAADGAAAPDQPTGPRDTAATRAGRARRQYCWWVTFAYPLPDTVQRLGLKTPDNFTRQSWLEAVRTAHEKARVKLDEAAVFLERHQRTDGTGRRLPHLNAVCRSASQYAWTGVAAALFKDFHVRVDFSEHIKTWYDGIVYGTVSSDHKPQEELDVEPLQWAASGAPLPFQEVLPAKWHKQGRQPKMSRLQVLDVIRKNGLSSELEVYAFAAAEEERGQRGLVAFLAECDCLQALLAKAAMLSSAASDLARNKLTRVEVLRKAAETACSCPTPGLWLELADAVLARNDLEGTFERAVYRALAEGRKKMNSVFLLGPSNCGKSFLVKPLKEIYRVYEQPDGGTYQLEAMLGKEVVFLNDFEWDHAEKWCRWAYFKNFLEGGSLPVARPKNRGDNTVFELDSPVIGTCASPVQLMCKQGRAWVVNQLETVQMQNRIRYLQLTRPISADEVRECGACRRCAAELYLRGSSPKPLPQLPLQGTAGDFRPRSRSPRQR